MRTATVREAKEHLEELIAAATAGEQVEITADGGEALASLIAPNAPKTEPGAGAGRSTLAADDVWDHRLRRLESQGLVSRSRGGRKPVFPQLAEPIKSLGVLDALIEERREGR